MKILLVCFGGWSSSLLSQGIEKELSARGISAKITTMSVELGLGQIGLYDVVLVAPQVRHMFRSVKKASESSARPALEITMQEYGMHDAKRVVDRILAVTKQPE